MLDDHILKAQTMHSSAYIKPFEEEMKTWEDKLISMQVKFIFRVYFSILIGAAKYQHSKPVFRNKIIICIWACLFIGKSKWLFVVEE